MEEAKVRVRVTVTMATELEPDALIKKKTGGAKQLLRMKARHKDNCKRIFSISLSVQFTLIL